MYLACANLFDFLSTFSCAGSPQDKSKGKKAPVIPKCRSMSILRTRFANTRKNKGEDSGPKVVMTVDADESDEGAAVKTKIGACKQDSDSLDEDLDEDQHHDHDGGMHTDPDTHPEELDSPIMPFDSSIDHGQRIVTESVSNDFLACFTWYSRIACCLL